MKPKLLNKTASARFAFTLITLVFFSTIFSQISFAFSDTGDDIYSKGIDFLTTEKIINGYPDGTFKPEKTLNRAEMMKIVVGAALKNSSTSSTNTAGNLESYANQKCFEDVPAGQWFTKYVCYGKAQGWIVGYDKGRFFRPAQTVTFVEGLKITLKGFGISSSEGEIWYKPIVERASQDNLIPHSITNFTYPLKRSQMADLIARSLHSTRSTLESYLGDRAAYNVTYETILAGLDLTKLQETTLIP